MSVPLDDQWYFFRHVPKYTLLDLEFFEKILLSSDIKKEIFEKALELGYTRIEGEKIKKQIERQLFHPNFPQFEVELLEKRYANLALSHIVQERISNNEILPKDIVVLDWLLAQYEPHMTNSFLTPIPKGIISPIFDKDKWVSGLKIDLENTFQYSDEWITLYSHSMYRFDDVASPYGYEDEELIVSFSSDENISFKINQNELFEIPLCKTIDEFKKISIRSTNKFSISPFLIIKQNFGNYFEPTILVKVDKNIEELMKLSWDDSNILNMNFNDSTVIRYQSWGTSFDGDSHSRNRTGHGVRLQIKKEFLIDYLITSKQSLFVSCEKRRQLIQERLNYSNVKESKELIEQKTFTAQKLNNLKN